jgi:hypothetical protein
MALLSFTLSPLTPHFVDAVFVPPPALDNALVQQEEKDDGSMEMKMSSMEIGGELVETQSKQEKGLTPPERHEFVGCEKATVSEKADTERVEMKEKTSPRVNEAENEKPLRLDAATRKLKEAVEEKRNEEEQRQLQREEDDGQLEQLQEEMRRMKVRGKGRLERQERQPQCQVN